MRLRRPGCRAALVTAVGLAATWINAGGVAAQTSVVVRGGWMVGNHTSTAAALEWVPAPSYDVRLTRRLRPGIALAAGYARTAFGCEQGFCRGSEPTVTGRHAVVGAELSRSGIWGRIGVMYGTVRVGTAGEAPQAGLGLEAGVGFRLRWGRLGLAPGASWRRMSANTPSRADHAVALGIDLGVEWTFD